MSEPAHELPGLDAEDALRGVVNQLIVNGERMPVIIPGSVIEALHLFAIVLANVQEAGRLPRYLLQAMPGASGLSEDDLNEFASGLTVAANAGEHAPECVATVMREWRETAEILSDPETMSALTEADEAIARGDIVRGRKAHLSTFRVQYKIDEESRTVTIRQVAHCRDAYGPGSHP